MSGIERKEIVFNADEENYREKIPTLLQIIQKFLANDIKYQALISKCLSVILGSYPELNSYVSQNLTNPNMEEPQRQESQI